MTTDRPQPRPNMSTQQKARAEAAEAAKSILTSRVTGGAFGAQTKVDVTDIHALASWILTGADPWPITEARAVSDGLAGLIEAYDLLFSPEGHAKADEFRGINLWVKAGYLESSEPELALWMKKLHSVLNPADVAAYERTSIEELRERLTGSPLGQPKIGDGYPPADVTGVPWQDADPDRTKDLTGEPVQPPEVQPLTKCPECGDLVMVDSAHFDGKEWLCHPEDAVSGDTLHNDGDGEPADG